MCEFLGSHKLLQIATVKKKLPLLFRVHYDPRIFSAKQTRSEKKKIEDPEKEYFENMSRFYGEMNEKFSGKPMTRIDKQEETTKVVFTFYCESMSITNSCSKTRIH